MTSVGALKFGAKIEGGDKSIKKVKKLKAQFNELGGTAQMAAEDMDDTADAADSVGDKQDEAGSSTASLTTKFALAASSAFGLNMTLTSLSGVLAGGVGTVGLTAAVIAAAVAVGFLASELAGVTNLTPLASREMTGLTGAFLDFAMVGTGPVVVALAAIEGYLNNGIPGAAAASRGAMVELSKATKRTAIRMGALVFKAGSYVAQFLTNIVSSTVNGITNMVNRGISALNSLIKAYNKKAGKLPGIGDDVQLSTVGKVENPSIDQRYANNAKQFGQYRQYISGVEKKKLQKYPVKPATSHPRPGTNTQETKGDSKVEKIEVNVDNSGRGNMSRSEARDLARQISKELDIEINSIR